MPTFTEIAKATKKKREIKLVGVDMYIITDKGIPKFDDIGPFKCEFISNRGTKVWPGFVSLIYCRSIGTVAGSLPPKMCRTQTSIRSWTP